MTRKRQPQHVYDTCRRLHAEGQSWVSIAFATGLDEEQIKRATDPDYAKKQSQMFARRNVLRKRGVTNPR